MNKQTIVSAVLITALTIRGVGSFMSPKAEAVTDEEPAIQQVEVIRVGSPKEKVAGTNATEEVVKPAIEIEDNPVPKSAWFEEDYLAKQLALKEYADEYSTFEVNGVTIDGLAVMAQANCESAYMCDTSQSLSALYPTIFVDYNTEEDLITLGIDKVWANEDALNGTYITKPGWYIKAGPYYAWTSGDGIYEQGPLQTRVSSSALEALEGYQSEEDKLINAGLLDYCEDTVYGVEATSLVTGTEYLEYCLGYESTGDRWAIADNCVIYKETKEKVLNQLWDSYYSTCGYTPNEYELLGILAYCHWIPGVIKSGADLSTIQYYGFAYDGAWYDVTHQISSEEGIEIIRNYVRQKIDENRALIDEGYSKDECNALLQLSIRTGSTTNPEESEPWIIFNQLVDAGVLDASAVITNPEYGYQHAMKYAIQYLYSYIMLEELLINNY